MIKSISVTHALSRLKTLDKQIEKNISNFKCVGVLVGKKLMNNQPTQEFEKNIKTVFQTLNDLIAYRSQLKYAIVKSNSITKVTINGAQLTVAEAIETKSYIKVKKEFLKQLQKEYYEAIRDIENINRNIIPRLDKLIESTFGGKDQKIKQDDYESISKPFMESNEAKLLDPINILIVIKNLESEIDDFESEVDIILSESNAITMIEITLM